MELKNKVVLITGAGRGIGKSTAKAFAKKGCKVIVTYNSNKKKAEKVYAICKKYNDAYLMKLNVLDNRSITSSLKELEQKFLIPDILINNSGVLYWKSLKKHSFEEIEHMNRVNVEGPMKVTATYVPALTKKKGAIIINIASIAPKYASKGLIPYSATKAAVVNFTKGLANELTSKIRSYCVSPGLTSTNMTKYMGVPTSKVSNVIINVAEESLNMKSGEDVDVREHY